MLLFRYDKLFKIRVLHGYYSALVSKDLDFLPTLSCKSKLDGNGLKFRKDKDGLTVFASVEEDGKLTRSLGALDKLTFGIYLKNPSFMNFSDLPLDQQTGQVFYFNNKTVNKTEIFSTGSDSLLLHQGNYTAVDELVRLEKEVYKFSYTNTGTEKTGQLVYTDTGLVVREKTVEKVEGSFNFEFILSGLKAGRYHLDIGGTAEDSFYFPGDLKTGRLFGIVEVYATVPNDNKFFNSSGDVLFKEYTVAFNNRKTTWNYHIVNKNGATLTDPIVRELTNPWNFTKLSDDLYESDAMMPLLEEPIAGIEFLTDKNDAGSVLVQNLPNPGVELIKPDPSDITRIYSDIYVYI
jgi:hypothetical protein